MRKYSYFLKQIIKDQYRTYEWPIKIYATLAYAKKEAKKRNLQSYVIYRSTGFMYDKGEIVYQENNTDCN